MPICFVFIFFKKILQKAKRYYNILFDLLNAAKRLISLQDALLHLIYER